jgi:aldehyde dehydrogenase (NAD+)
MHPISENANMHGKSYIGGRWVDGEDRRMQNIDPGNLENLGSFTTCTAEQVRAAVDSAEEGLDEMKNLKAANRAKILAVAAENVRKGFDEISMTLAREGGKLLSDARYETKRCIQTLEIASEEARRIDGDVIPLDAYETPDLSNRFGFTRREPVGIVAAVVPFNFPLMMPAHKIAPAIAAGNSVVLKPSPDVPFSAASLVKCLLEAGLPKKAINMVYAEGNAVAESLIANPKVRMVVFTGSTATGKRIAEIAACDAKKVSLEMGGKNPMIVFEDADIDDALTGAIRGGYTHAGQVCIATGRILVQEKVYDEFAGKLAAMAAQRRVGYQLDEGTETGPMINKARLDTVSNYIDEARSAGLPVLTGGHVVDMKGYYYKPTVIGDVSPKDRIAREEVFGPVLPLMRFSMLDEAVDIANSLPYGLSSAIYTRSMEKAFRCIERLESGSVSVNDSTVMRADQAPFGGYKWSGLGREGLKHAIREMTEIKMVYWKKYDI